MKKIIILFFLLLVFWLNIFGLDQKEDYVKAYGEKNHIERIKAFEAYLAKYSDSEYHKDIYVLLVSDCLKVDQQVKAFEYAKKAEKFIAKLSDEQKAGIYIVLSANYFSKGNQAMASEYAERVIKLSIGKQGETWDDFLASASNIKKAASISPVKKAITLYSQKKYIEAEKGFAELYKSNGTDFEIVYWYAKSLAKNKKSDQALEKFEEAYELKKDGIVAYNIGIILSRKAKMNEKLIIEAVNYLLEASLLSSKQSESARRLAESLFFGNYRDKETKLDYNGLIKRIEEMNSKIRKMVDDFNEKYQDKEEEEIDEKQMKSDLKEIEDLKKGAEKLEAKTKKTVDEFNELLKKAEKRITKLKANMFIAKKRGKI